MEEGVHFVVIYKTVGHGDSFGFHRVVVSVIEILDVFVIKISDFTTDGHWC